MVKIYKFESEQAVITIEFPFPSKEIEVRNTGFVPINVDFFNGTYRIDGGQVRKWETSLLKIKLLFDKLASIIILVTIN